MSRLTIQSIQERFPWVMRLPAFVDVLLTPRRWAPPILQGAATSITAALTGDTLGLARRLRRVLGWLSTLRAAVLRDRPRMQRVAWFFRQQVWAAVWSFIVVMRLWPRRVPVPAPDVPIRLIPAPETYPDFQSPTLVVPSDVPREEMSLPGAITVQAIHALQDLYPVVSTYQPEASRDPRERARHGYPWLFRLVRSPPVWHADLVEAQQRGRLLDVLAVGAVCQAARAKRTPRVPDRPGLPARLSGARGPEPAGLPDPVCRGSRYIGRGDGRGAQRHTGDAGRHTLAAR